MSTEWAWGDNKKAVAMTEQDIKTVIERIVEAITANSQSTLLDQYKQFLRVEGELAQSREREGTLRAEVASLRAHINHLNSFLTTLAPVNGAMSVPSAYPNTQAQMPSDLVARMTQPPPLD